MAPRDPNEYEQRRNQILEGALKVFAAKGFENATNKDIAEAAGIGSPGLLYHYFSDKADLLQKVVERNLALINLIGHPEGLMELPPRQALTLFGRTMLSALENKALFAAYKLIMSEVIRRPKVAEMINQIGPSRVFPVLIRYFEHQMALGNLRTMDPAIATRCFIGPLAVYAVTREFFPQADSMSLSIDVMVENAVDIFLRGMEPRDQPADPGS